MIRRLFSCKVCVQFLTPRYSNVTHGRPLLGRPNATARPCWGRYNIANQQLLNDCSLPDTYVVAVQNRHTLAG